MKISRKSRKFIYLISPNKINNPQIFYKELEKILVLKKVQFFQLRLKNQRQDQIIEIGRKIRTLCKKYGTKFIVNDNPYTAKKLSADGCHLGQKDIKFLEAKKIIKNKIIGITCHNSINLAKRALSNGANYIAIGAFYQTRTKKIKHKANLRTLKRIKKVVKIPLVAIGGINEENYKKLLLNKADFLAMSGYIWNNKKLKPHQAIKNLK